MTEATRPLPPPAVLKLIEELGYSLGTLDLTLGPNARPADGSNPIRDVPPIDEPRLSDPKAILDRARLTNIGYEGGRTKLASLAQVASARRQVAAWCGDVLDVSLVNFKDGSFNLYAPEAEQKAEALRRWEWMHQTCDNEVLEYLALTGWMGESRLNPEPGMGLMATPCYGEAPFPMVTEGSGKVRKFGLADYVAEMDRRTAAGTASGGQR